MNIGMSELLVIFAIVLLLFGANKLPDVGRGLGRGLKNFKQTMKGDEPKTDEPSGKREA